MAFKCKTPEWSAYGPEHDSSKLESDNDTCNEPVSVPVGMSTPQPSCSTAQVPWPSPQHTPVLLTATGVTSACRLPSTAKDLLRSDGISPRNAPTIQTPAKEHGRVDWAPKLNTEEKVDGGEVSAWQRHCHHQPQRQLVDRAKELGVWRDLGKRYRRMRLQLRLADYLSKEELDLRFLKRPDNTGCVSFAFQHQSWRVRERDQHGTGPRDFGGEADRTGG